MFEMDREALEYGVTVIDNCFLMDYLPAAKGDYVKVYLWGLLHCQKREEEYSLTEMAHELFMTVPEVEAALRYWERRALVSRSSQSPIRYTFHSPLQRKFTAGTSLQVDQEYVSFTENVYAVFGDQRKITPAEIALAWEWVKDVGLPMEHCIADRLVPCHGAAE